MWSTATRGEEYQCVDCLPLTPHSLIPIMSGAGPRADCVAGMTAGLVLIRNDHRPGHKHVLVHTPVTHFKPCSHRQDARVFVTSVCAIIATSWSHFVNQIAASASECPPQLEAVTSGSPSPQSVQNKRRQHDWLCK